MNDKRMLICCISPPILNQSRPVAGSACCHALPACQTVCPATCPNQSELNTYHETIQCLLTGCQLF